MARDKGLEALVGDELGGLRELTQKAMFGGWVWLLRGNLLCGARVGSLLVRVGRENQLWALKIPGVTPMMMCERPMQGWVRLASEAYGDDKLRQKLITAAIEFTGSLPRK